MSTERITYTIINTQSFFAMDTQSKAEADFFYHLDVSYDVSCRNQNGESRIYNPNKPYLFPSKSASFNKPSKF